MLGELPLSLSPLSEGVSGNPGFDFFAMPVRQAGSSKVVFPSNREGNAEIYSMNADGSSLSRLTSNRFNDDHPRWSPDGARILFQSDRGNRESAKIDLPFMARIYKAEGIKIDRRNLKGYKIRASYFCDNRNSNHNSWPQFDRGARKRAGRPARSGACEHFRL